MRREGMASAGYFPTNSEIVTQVAPYLTVCEKGVTNYLDPCAGKGEAILQLIRLLHKEETSRVRQCYLYSIEMEASRHEVLKSSTHETIDNWQCSNHALLGDAFQATWKATSEGVGLLWLNPPYDLDKVHGRLEHKFLVRFAPTLTAGGVLVFLVPFYALKASAVLLATRFKNLQCFRFSGEHFDAYKQVALFAEKREVSLTLPDPTIETQILHWVERAENIPELGEVTSQYAIPATQMYVSALTDWVMQTVDTHALIQKHKAWSFTDRSGKIASIPGIMPEGTLDDLLTRQYPLAMPPRSAHIAAGIAAGVFNGERITPDNKTSKLPDILVKGVFDKEYRTVDEKLDKDGEVKGLIQVQQPKLVTTVLDLSTNTYTTITPSTAKTDAKTIPEMTMADFLGAYGEGLMGVMLRQCPVLHNPDKAEDQIPLESVARPLYKAQAQVAMAAVKLLGGAKATKVQRRGKSAFILGEIGSGKTQCSLAVANTIDAKSILVMCPPHLLNSWQDQINAVVPWYENYILSDINDVIAFAKRPKNSGPAIAILSRESAKLGHAYTGLKACGDCGTLCPVEDPVKKRYRCEHQPLQTKGDIGRLLYKWLNQLSLVFPDAFEISQWLDGQYRQKVRSILKTKAQLTEDYESTRWSQMVEKGSFDALILMLLDRANTQEEYEFLRQLLVCDLREDICLQVVRQIYTPVEEGETYRHSAKYLLARKLLLLLPRTDKVRECINECRNIDLDLDKETPSRSYYSSNNANIWEEWAKIERKVLSDEVFSDWTYGLSREGDKLLSGKTTVGQRSNVIALASTLARVHLKRGAACNEPLFQAIPEPRRFPLATFISRYYPELFDLFICDEVHEYASEAAAQTMAAQSIISLGIPTLALSGTIMTGYAQSLFMSMWALNPEFRKEFERDDMSRFVERFGYRKRLIEDKEVPESKVVAHGAMSDRIETTEKMIGNAPGVLPIFILKYLLPLSVTLHKSDLQIDIPKCSEHVEKIEVSSDLKQNYEYLQSTLMRQITADRKDPDLAGKLWGAMAELPSYLDMATEGNSDTGNYEIRYPKSVGGKLIASVPCLSPTIILPKEEWMLGKVKELLDAGRNVLVFGWHVKLLPRLAKLIETKLGVKCTTLNPTKVPTGKRETWINKEVVNKGIRVMVVNPLTVSTGLNNLVYFSDEIWMESPACNPIVYRQAVGRVDRIGQKKSTSIWFPTYEDTAQEELHSLLMHKVAVSMSTDGLDADSAMQAAGIGDTEGFSTFAVGRQLYELLIKNRQFQAS